MNKCKAPARAYLDSFGGLVSVEVTKVYRETYSGATLTRCRCTVTEKSKGYRKGEVVVRSPIHVVPEESVCIKDGVYKIKNNYVWEPCNAQES